MRFSQSTLHLSRDTCVARRETGVITPFIWSFYDDVRWSRLGFRFCGTRSPHSLHSNACPSLIRVHAQPCFQAFLALSLEISIRTRGMRNGVFNYIGVKLESQGLIWTGYGFV